MAVMIGVDPHKASHTAVAISAAEEPLGELRVWRSCLADGAVSAAWLRQRLPSPVRASVTSPTKTRRAC